MNKTVTAELELRLNSAEQGIKFYRFPK